MSSSEERQIYYSQELPHGKRTTSDSRGKGREDRVEAGETVWCIGCGRLVEGKRVISANRKDIDERMKE